MSVKRLLPTFASQMADFVTITIQEKDYIIEVLSRSYSHVLKLTGNDLELYFEPDESGDYRLFKMPWQDERTLKKVDAALILDILALLNKLQS